MYRVFQTDAGRFYVAYEAAGFHHAHSTDRPRRLHDTLEAAQAVADRLNKMERDFDTEEYA